MCLAKDSRHSQTYVQAFKYAPYSYILAIGGNVERFSDWI